MRDFFCLTLFVKKAIHLHDFNNSIQSMIIIMTFIKCLNYERKTIFHSDFADLHPEVLHMRQS
jgi:hypothetical protein